MLRPGVTREWVDEEAGLTCVHRILHQMKAWSSIYEGRITPRENSEAVGELDCSSAHICLRELGKSEDKAKKGCRCEATDSSAMGLAAPWYRRGGTSVESSIPCGRALVVKGAEEVENAKANSKYQDKAEGQRQGTS
ncbi:hypothetical protein GW17_00011473 [Ensete ventricosum]|nr:hypothetical protein GW17_00011473 [Ensete ventricosum]